MKYCVKYTTDDQSSELEDGVVYTPILQGDYCALDDLARSLADQVASHATNEGYSWAGLYLPGRKEVIAESFSANEA